MFVGVIADLSIETPKYFPFSFYLYSSVDDIIPMPNMINEPLSDPVAVDGNLKVMRLAKETESKFGTLYINDFTLYVWKITLFTLRL